jgi:hypothetical protein
MANENCLENIACPNCGQEDRFFITATCRAKVMDDGVDYAEDYEWADDSPIQCVVCHHSGRVIEFTVERPWTDESAQEFLTTYLARFQAAKEALAHLEQRRAEITAVRVSPPMHTEFDTLIERGRSLLEN